MSLWDFARRRFTLRDGAAFSAFYGGSSWAGKPTTQESVLQLSAAWSALRCKAQTVSTLPLGMYEKGARGSRSSASGHWLHDILAVSPNADQTPAEFWDGAHGCVALRGNFFARKAGLRGPANARQFASLETMHPDSVTIRREGGEVVFVWRDPDGKVVTLPEEEVFHLKGFGLGDALGLSTLRNGRQTFASSLSADEQAASIFKSGLQASGFLKVDQELKEPQRGKLQKIMDEFAGSSRAGRLMILEAGMQYQALTLNPEEAQLLATRRFHIEEICRWFGVPPILVGHAAEGQTMWGSGVEQIILAWLILDLRPYLVRTEQAIRKRLLGPSERANLYPLHAVEGLLRADSAGRAALYSSLIQNAVMQPAEAREKEDLPYIEGSDELLVQSSIVRLRDLGQTPSDANKAREALRSWLAEGMQKDRAA